MLETREQWENRLIIGVDEAGRGPLAGPVSVAALCFLCPQAEKDLAQRLDDSKKLSEKKREALFEELTSQPEKILWAHRFSPPEEIDALNILQATLKAMGDVAGTLYNTPHPSTPLILVDGNHPIKTLPSKAVIKGDGRVAAIAGASIIAKVLRDREMVKLDQEFPMYGWKQNKGYGSKAHRDAIGKHGMTPHHRKSFRLKTAA